MLQNLHNHHRRIIGTFVDAAKVMLDQYPVKGLGYELFNPTMSFAYFGVRKSDKNHTFAIAVDTLYVPSGKAINW